MRATLTSLLLGAVVACLTGCAHRAPRPAPACWVEQFGGRETGERELRLARVTRAVLPEHLHPRVRTAVLCCSEPAAYSWPSGEIFVTRGLLDLLSDDDHLAAAVAHEAGHLLTEPPRHRHRHGIESLRGGAVGGRDAVDHDVDLQAECDADLAGVQLLRGAGMNSSSMTDMLCKVRDAATLAPRYHHEMTHRIERLRRRHMAP